MRIFKNILTLLIVVILILILRIYVVGFFFVQSDSMTPLIVKEDIIIISKNAYWFDNPQKGEVIVFRLEDEKLIKRVHSIKNDSIFVLGDNLSNSTDSRIFGFIHKDDVIGKAILKFNSSTLEVLK